MFYYWPSKAGRFALSSRVSIRSYYKLFSSKRWYLKWSNIRFSMNTYHIDCLGLFEIKLKSTWQSNKELTCFTWRHCSPVMWQPQQKLIRRFSPKYFTKVFVSIFPCGKIFNNVWWLLKVHMPFLTLLFYVRNWPKLCQGDDLY